MKDYIEREAALAVIRRLRGPARSPAQNIMIQTADAQMRRIPAANVASVKLGKWENAGGDQWSCTACGWIVNTEGSWEKPDAKFCEECGAKMEASKND